MEADGDHRDAPAPEQALLPTDRARALLETAELHHDVEHPDLEGTRWVKAKQAVVRAVRPVTTHQAEVNRELIAAVRTLTDQVEQLQASVEHLSHGGTPRAVEAALGRLADHEVVLDELRERQQQLSDRIETDPTAG